MKTTTCCVCGIEFGMPDNIHGARLVDGKCFYCPNGHRQAYADSDLAKLRKKNRELVRQVHKLTAEKKEAWDNYERACRGWQQASSEATTAKLRAAGYKSQWLRVKRLGVIQ